MKKEIMENIKTEYNRKRLKAAADVDIRKIELYENIPDLEILDKEIKLMGIKISKVILFGADDSQKEAIRLREELEELKEQKKYIYQTHHVPENFLEPDYECKQCSDTGYLPNGTKCKCFTRQIINQLYNMSNMKAMLEKENFGTFNINIFSNSQYNDLPLTPRQNMYGILGTCEDFCYNFDKINTNLLFYGGTGLGKTFMCNCIAKVLIDKSKSVLYQTAFSLFETLETHKFNRQNETEENLVNYNMMFESELLIIDDLGTETMNSFTNGELFNIINYRIITDKKTVISTNLPLEQLATTYSDRIMSRVFNKFIVCEFYGTDLRLQQ